MTFDTLVANIVTIATIFAICFSTAAIGLLLSGIAAVRQMYLQGKLFKLRYAQQLKAQNAEDSTSCKR